VEKRLKALEAWAVQDGILFTAADLLNDRLTHMEKWFAANWSAATMLAVESRNAVKVLLGGS